MIPMEGLQGILVSLRARLDSVMPPCTAKYNLNGKRDQGMMIWASMLETKFYILR
jgi:hypothetical protein